MTRNPHPGVGGVGGVDPMILLMDEILHHLGWLKPYSGIILILGGAGFCSSTVCPIIVNSKNWLVLYLSTLLLHLLII